MVGSLQQHFPDSEFLFCNALSIVFSLFNMNNLKMSHLRATWSMLRSVHELGVCHRDCVFRISGIVSQTLITTWCIYWTGVQPSQSEILVSQFYQKDIVKEVHAMRRLIFRSG
mmetsp:Transcript_20380/g.29269  ORF Transcript_20380/g.29269 Transcript_20380/m.29269 type:complete len:113 (+) Transcript_20380:209-547(+)